MILKLSKFLNRKQPQLPDWRSDWLYALVFREVELSWDRFCKGKRLGEYLRYVLVEEWSSAENTFCKGQIIRAWVHNRNGLHKISLWDYARRTRNRDTPSGIFHFVIISFHIYPDKTHVVLNHQEANTAGGGEKYIVARDGTNVKLEFDPSGGFWIS